MIEVKIHGRGGQGAVIASEILAIAFFDEGSYVQAFPTFGVERRGAPVAAFLRADSSPIRLRCQIAAPSHVIVLDPTLMHSIDVVGGLQPGGLLLLNSDHAPGSFADFVGRGFRVACVDAGRIAADHGLGSRLNPIVNTSILGAFAAASGLVQLDSILRAIPGKVPSRVENNLAAARKSYEAVRLASVQETAG